MRTFRGALQGYHLALFSKNKFSSSFILNEGLWHGLIIAKANFNGKEVTFMLTHLCPKNEDKRLEEIKTIKNHLKKDDSIILMGDLNSLSPQDVYDEKTIIKEMKKRKFVKFGKDKLRKEVITKILEFNFVDVVMKCSDQFEYSVPTSVIALYEDHPHFTRLRYDYIFIKKLASYLVHAEIIRNSITDKLSDHYPVVAELNI